MAPGPDLTLPERPGLCQREGSEMDTRPRLLDVAQRPGKLAEGIGDDPH